MDDNTRINDTVIHMKDNDGLERIILPITKYDNILFAPKVIEDSSINSNALFNILSTNEEDVDDTILLQMTGMKY